MQISSLDETYAYAKISASVIILHVKKIRRTTNTLTLSNDNIRRHAKTTNVPKRIYAY